jgi:hypothetical protein
MESKVALRLFLLIASSTPAILAGCNSGQDGSSNGPGNRIGDSVAPGMPNNPAGITGVVAKPGDPNVITIAANYVALKPDANTAASPTQAEVTTLFQNISAVWSQCQIQIVVEEYSSPVASAVGLAYNPANQSQLEDDRVKFDDGRHALYVKTGTWNRSGDLGADGSNGWSTLPPSVPEGTVIEESVDLNTLLIAHESGHLIGALDHTTDPTNLMNHFVTTDTKLLNASQCAAMRATIQQYHQAWMR